MPVVPDLLEFGDVRADGEVLARAPEHDAPDIPVGGEAGEYLGQFSPHRERHGIFHGGPVQNDVDDDVAPLDANFLRHVTSLALSRRFPGLFDVQSAPVVTCISRLIR